MNDLGHFKQLKNILLFEAEKEKEIRSDLANKINKNSLKKHELGDMTGIGGDGGAL